MTNPIEESMRDFAVDQLEKEASFLIQGCEDNKHDWHYNKNSDEVYCGACGAYNGEYKGMGVTLMEIHRMLKKNESNS